MKVFVTGATGLLGRELVPRLLAEGYEVSALCREENPDRVKKVPGFDRVEWFEGNLGDLSVLQQAIEKTDFVIHAAGLVSFDPGDRKDLHRVNVEGTANVVNVCLVAGQLKKLIHISSVAALSPSKPMPAEVDERQGFNPDSNTSDYAWSKYNAELEVIRAVEEGLNAVVLNPSIILSPGEANESSAGLFGYVQKERPFYPAGWINFVDVRDIATVALELLKRGPSHGERILLSAGHLPYRDFFSAVARFLGKKAPSIESRPWMTALGWRMEMLRSFFTGSRPLLTKYTAASSSKRLIYKGKALTDFWPDFRFHPLEETLEWILVNKE